MLEMASAAAVASANGPGGQSAPSRISTRRRIGSLNNVCRGKSGDRDGVPWNHRLMRRHAEHRQRDISGRCVRFERDQRSQCGRECLRRGSQEPLMRISMLTDASFDELPLSGTGAQHDGWLTESERAA